MNFAKTEAQKQYKTCTFAFDNLVALSCSKVVVIRGIVCHSIVDTPRQIVFTIQDQSLRNIKHVGLFFNLV